MSEDKASKKTAKPSKAEQDAARELAEYKEKVAIESELFVLKEMALDEARNKARSKIEAKKYMDRPDTKMILARAKKNVKFIPPYARGDK